MDSFLVGDWGLFESCRLILSLLAEFIDIACDAPELRHRDRSSSFPDNCSVIPLVFELLPLLMGLCGVIALPPDGRANLPATGIFEMVEF